MNEVLLEFPIKDWKFIELPVCSPKLPPDGLEVVGMTVFNNTLFVAMKHGVYYKDDQDQLIPLKILAESPFKETS